jgi:2-polyprenyl-3-methyl-5-hydroxy-6-metoxy-1,4-benzoquinol methylase
MIKSPITGNKNVKEIVKIDSSIILDKYHSNFGVNIEHIFKGIKSVSLMECLDTGYRFYHPFHLAGDGDFYNILNIAFTGKEYYPTWKQEYNFAISGLNSETKILDIGCGDGKFLAKASTIAEKAVGIDFSEAAIEKVVSQGIEAHASTLGEFKKKNSLRFNYITAFQVLEHLVDIKEFLDDALSLLEINGKLVLAVPNNSPYLFGYEFLEPLNLPPHHMGLWNADSFKKLERYFPIKLQSIHYEKNEPFRRYLFAVSTYVNYKLFGYTAYKNKFLKALVTIVLSPLLVPLTLLNLLTGKVKGVTITCIFVKNV